MILAAACSCSCSCWFTLPGPAKSWRREKGYSAPAEVWEEIRVGLLRRRDCTSHAHTGVSHSPQQAIHSCLLLCWVETSAAIFLGAAHKKRMHTSGIAAPAAPSGNRAPGDSGTAIVAAVQTPRHPHRRPRRGRPARRSRHRHPQTQNRVAPSPPAAAPPPRRTRGGPNRSRRGTGRRGRRGVAGAARQARGSRLWVRRAATASPYLI